MTLGEWEFIRSVYEDWQEGDFTAMEWAPPEIEFVVADGPAVGTWRGRDAMSRAWGEVLGAWVGLRSQAEEFRPLDDGRLLVLTRNSGRGKSSGLELGEMQTRGANLLSREGRLVTRFLAYWNRDAVLEELG
jgi:hypothetical protein